MFYFIYGKKILLSNMYLYLFVYVMTDDDLIRENLIHFVTYINV